MPNNSNRSEAMRQRDITRAAAIDRANRRSDSVQYHTNYQRFARQEQATSVARSKRRYLSPDVAEEVLAV